MVVLTCGLIPHDVAVLERMGEFKFFHCKDLNSGLGFLETTNDRVVLVLVDVEDAEGQQWRDVIAYGIPVVVARRLAGFDTLVEMCHQGASNVIRCRPIEPADALRSLSAAAQ